MSSKLFTGKKDSHEFKNPKLGYNLGKKFSDRPSLSKINSTSNINYIIGNIKPKHNIKPNFSRNQPSGISASLKRNSTASFNHSLRKEGLKGLEGQMIK